ncbi:Homoserine O-acetyltransferase [Rhodomicrobium vannielii ATCC 17100]|uniref:Homoserine O-acetyltransferase n=1 Tax=Rhodomicrobium vannielii (strain ATCC 17100 / DSM 162 / LMG 4299 / NCIMB 10020 / ATH 3.1.1) TaxID=648757 RepID=E3I215_RHOVT|nr:Homoserine O-acetyltransferase [Rhodomicrobium vannielii ATCC 17100]
MSDCYSGQRAVADNYYSQDIHGPFQTVDIGDFELESGGKLRNLNLAYATFGTLSEKKDNAILFPTWYSGTNKILELAYIGEGRALDPSRYFIILVNQIGNGLSASPSNTPIPFNAAAFPSVTIGDDVRAQHKLVTEKFGIEKLALVLGGSMGAQQTYEWAIRFPDAVQRAAPIAGLGRGTPYTKLLVETFIEAIASDPAFDGGWYADKAAVQRGLRRHARLFAASGFSPALYTNEGWLDLGFSSAEDFLRGFLEGHFLPQDPNNLILLARKWRDHDVGRNAGGSLKEAFARITAKTFVIAIENDAFFPLKDVAAEQELIPDSELKLVSSDWGHLALFATEAAYRETVDGYLKELLAQA